MKCTEDKCIELLPKFVSDDVHCTVIVKYKQNIVKHNSMILLRCILILFLSTTCFGSSYEPSSGRLLFLSIAKYTISNAIVIVFYEISYNFYKNLE